MTSGLEFLFQALGVPALVPLPTRKKYKEKEDINAGGNLLMETAPHFDGSLTHPI